MTDRSNIVERAQALIDKVERELAATDDVYRKLGLNPDKVRSVIQSQSTAQTEADGLQAFEADMADVEQEVREELARQSFRGAASTGGVKRPRTMI